jgi:large subunit ribosomal protein L9
MKTSWENQEMRERKAFQDMADKLEGMVLKVTKRAGDKGRLFGSVTSQELSDEIKGQVGLDIDKKLVVADHIKEIGEHPITIRFTGEVKAQLKVVVVPEETEQ